jgi:hypothetical protein
MLTDIRGRSTHPVWSINMVREPPIVVSCSLTVARGATVFPLESLAKKLKLVGSPDFLVQAMSVFVLATTCGAKLKLRADTMHGPRTPFKPLILPNNSIRTKRPVEYGEPRTTTGASW